MDWKRCSQPHHLSSDENINEPHSTKIPFHPPTRRFSNIDNENQLFILFPFIRRLTSNKRHSSLNDTDNTQIQLPLVMITDTDSSYTNIVELETFEDKQPFLTDIERRVSIQLKASYHSRHST
jgi:hypothetical protein